MRSTPIPLHVNIAAMLPTPVRGDVVTITWRRCGPRAGNPDIGAASIVEPMALDPDGSSAGRPRPVYAGGRRGCRGRLRDDDLGGRLFFRGVKRAVVVIEAVANCTAQSGAGDAADDRSTRRVAVTAVVADDGAG